jgi:hypothetical protein
MFTLVLWFFLLLYFTLCHFVTKKGSNFIWTRSVLFNQSSVFIPEWSKGQFVSL